MHVYIALSLSVCMCVFYLWNYSHSLANRILRRAGVFAAILLLDVGNIHMADDIVVDGNILTH